MFRWARIRNSGFVAISSGGLASLLTVLAGRSSIELVRQPSWPLFLLALLGIALAAGWNRLGYFLAVQSIEDTRAPASIVQTLGSFPRANRLMSVTRFLRFVLVVASWFLLLTWSAKEIMTSFLAAALLLAGLAFQLIKYVELIALRAIAAGDTVAGAFFSANQTLLANFSHLLRWSLTWGVVALPLHLALFAIFILAMRQSTPLGIAIVSGFFCGAMAEAARMLSFEALFTRLAPAQSGS